MAIRNAAERDGESGSKSDSEGLLGLGGRLVGWGG